MITDYSFDKEVYVDNLKIYNYDCQSRYNWLWLLVILLTKWYVDNLIISDYDF